MPAPLHRVRRPRPRTARIGAAGVVVVLATALAVVPDRTGDERGVTGVGRTETTAVVPVPASPLPAILVAATPGGTGRPGDIQLLSANDGTVVRTLAQAYGPYPSNGMALSPDGRHAYFVRLLEAEQRFEIAGVSTDGGPVEHFAFGTRPSFDPSGRKMAYVSDRDRLLVVRDMATGTERAFDPEDLPDAAKGEVVGAFSALAWLDDGRRLGVLTSKPGERRRGCAFGSACPTTTTQPPTTATSHVLVFDPEAASLADAEVHPAPVGTDWTFLARGPQPGSLVVTGIPVARGVEYVTSISLIAPGEPERQPRSIGSLPPAAQPVALDSSGQHLLYQTYLDGGGLFRHSILGDAPPVRLGGEYINASW